MKCDVSSGALDPRLAPVDGEALTREDVEDRATRWAQALANTLGAPAGVAAPGVGELTAPTRQTTGAGTDAEPVPGTRAAPNGAASGSEGSPSDTQTLSLRVNAGDLGEITLVVDRAISGTRISIGVDNAHAARAFGPERAALQQALEAYGIRVESVVVVNTRQVGTTIAGRVEAASRAKEASKYKEHVGGESSQRKKRLKLIG